MGNLGKPHNKCRNAHFTQWGQIVVKREVNTQMANWVPRCLTFVLSHWTRVHWWKCHSTRGSPKAQCPLPCYPVTRDELSLLCLLSKTKPQLEPTMACAAFCGFLSVVSMFSATLGTQTLWHPAFHFEPPSSKISLFSLSRVSFLTHLLWAMPIICRKPPGFPPPRGSGWCQNYPPTVKTDKIIELKLHDL